MENKKNSNVLVVVLSVLVGVLLVICLLLGYIAFGKDDNKSNGKESESVEKLDEDNKKSEDLYINSEVVKELYKMTDCIKFYDVLRKEIYGEQKITVDQMSDYYKQLITAKYYENNVVCQIQANGENACSVDMEDVKNAYDSVFGTGYYKKEVAAYYKCMGMSYDLQTNKYLIRHFACGLEMFTNAYEKVVSATKYKDRIEVTVAVLFRSPDAYYSDVNMTNILAGLNVNSDKAQQVLNDKQDILPKYTYTFKLNKNGDYNYYSVEKLKN